MSSRRLIPVIGTGLAGFSSFKPVTPLRTMEIMQSSKYLLRQVLTNIGIGSHLGMYVKKTLNLRRQCTVKIDFKHGVEKQGSC